MAAAVIVDTNVVVAGLLTARADSPVARVLDGMLAAAFPYVLSEALLGEYGSVLSRPALRKCHGLSTAEVDVILLALARHAIVLKPGRSAPAPDPGDQHLWDLLAARKDLLLISGDKRLQGDVAMGPRVLSAADFVSNGFF